MFIVTIRPGQGRVLKPERRDHVIIAATILGSALYATLRYNVFKGVSWTDWPLYVANKVLAIAALLLVVLAALRVATPQGRQIRRLMGWASAMALAHSLASLALLEPSYFEKFYWDERLTAVAGASLLLGSLAFVLLQWGKGQPGTAAPDSAVLPLSGIAFLSGLHAALPSGASWLSPSSWPGYMPPITLISFVAGVIAVAAPLRPSRRRT
jgi:hypothetical protein